MKTPDRFFEINIIQGWRETPLGFTHGASHNAIAQGLPLASKRITNERFREIETTGQYYRITEQGKGGKAFIFEIV